MDRLFNICACRSTDHSTFVRSEFSGTERRWVWDRRVSLGDWVLIPDALVFAAVFKHEASVASIADPNGGYKSYTSIVDIIVNPKEFTQAEAEKRMLPYLVALGRVPACLLTRLKEVELLSGNKGVSGYVNNCIAHRRFYRMHAVGLSLNLFLMHT